MEWSGGMPDWILAPTLVVQRHISATLVTHNTPHPNPNPDPNRYCVLGPS